MTVSLSLQLVPTPAHLRALQRLLRQKASAPAVSATQTRIYFDTPRAHLRADGLVLYVHRIEGLWEYLLAHESGKLLIDTRQWRAVYAGGFEFSMVDDPDIAHRLSRGKVRNSLARVFEARVRCTTWQVESGSATVEVCLERSTLRAGGAGENDPDSARREPVSRLRLTNPGNDYAPLFVLAAELVAAAPALPAVESLADMGARLHDGSRRPPVRSSPLDLRDDDTVIGAFRHIVYACLHHWLANRDGAIATPDDPEFVHQLRVAIRRLRAALQVFRSALPESFVDAILPTLRTLMATLGRTRDLDVLVHEITGPVLKALPDEPRVRQLDDCLGQQLLAARHEAARSLQHRDLSRQILVMCVRIEALSVEVTPHPAAQLPLREFVDRQLRKRLKAAQRCAANARADDPTSLHELRIAIKRLRYGLEFFDSLLPKGVAAKVLRRLATLQDELGQLNDLASAGALLMASAGDEAPLREAVTLVAGWHGARYARLLGDIPKHLASVERLRLPRLSTKERGQVEQASPSVPVRMTGAELPPTLD